MASTVQLGGRYTLIRKLGEGATKEVFLARDETLEREVALCRFKPQALSRGYLERIRREAKLLAGLSHPAIVALHDLREDDGCYLITEHVPGGSLKSLLAGRDRGLDLDEALAIAIRVADALAETHTRGIFHRDVKPGNVLVDAGGRAKLGDFGLACPLGDESISEEGLIVGSVPYMSPEQAKGLPPDSPGDMYSLGVMLFEMVTGRRPFHGEDASVLVHHLNSEPPPPTRYVLHCPAPLETLILRLLDKRAEERPNASEAAAALRRIRAELASPADAGHGGTGDIRSSAAANDALAVAVSTDPAAASPPGGPGARPDIGRRRRWLPAVAFLCLTAAALAWWRPWHVTPPPHSIGRICAIDRQAWYDIVDGPATADELSELYRLSADNRPIFEHLATLRELHRAGTGHRGVTYVYGAPGVGKSFLVRNHLAHAFPGQGRCLVKLGDVFQRPASRLGFEVCERAELASVDGSMTLGRLPAACNARGFALRRMLAASGCSQDGAPRWLVIDDIDEIHPDTARLLLREVDRLILDRTQPSDSFLHVVVVGGASGFAPWYRDPRRHGGIAHFHSAFRLRGPVYGTSGDVEVLAGNLLEFQKGADHWARAVRDGTAARLTSQYLRYARRHPFLSHSLRPLAIATFLSLRASVSPHDSEPEVKKFLLDELLRRATEMHGRPDPGDDAYREVLERIAVMYLHELDDQGFFVVERDDLVAMRHGEVEQVQLRVREVLDRSGITITDPGSHSTARYRFEPVWVQAHLVEQANRRRDPDHGYRSCAAS